jgi:S1-C subfamily serine protease
MTEELNKMAQSYVQVEGGLVGSGSIVLHQARNSWVLTCEHVVRGEQVVTVAFLENGRMRRVNARIVSVDVVNDLALIRTAQRIPHRAEVEIAPDEPGIYERGYVMGSAAGLYGTAGEVVITALPGAALGPSYPWYQFTGLAVQGISGGLLCNYDAQLVGVPHQIEREENRTLGNIGFAVPLPVIQAFLAEHLPGGVPA